MNAKLLAFMVMELGWKALLVYTLWLWGSPFAGQDLMMLTVVVSGIVQLTYLLSYKQAPAPLKSQAPKRAEPKQKESK